MTLIDYIKSKFRVNYISYHYSSLKGESSWNSISDETFDLYDTPLTSTNIKVTDFTIKFDLN